MSGRPQVTTLADLQPQAQRWLYGRLVLAGGLTVLAGAPGEGKSLFTAHVAAAVTNGTLGMPPAPVLYSSTEDDLSSVVAPRLYAAGAAPHRVYVVNSDIENLLLPQHAPWLAEQTRITGYGLIILDALLDHLSARTDTHNDHAVRSAMRPLRQIAAATGCGVLAVLHTNKGQSGDPMRRLGGSIAFSGQARSVLLLGRTENLAADERIVVQTKANYSASDAPGLRLRIVETDVPNAKGEQLRAARVEVIGTVNVDGRALLTAGARSRGSTVDTAAEFLVDYLAGGPRPTVEVETAADAQGISQSALRRARKQENVVSTRVGGAGAEGGWVLSLPPRIGSG